jgi:hypothetical protein
MLRPVSSVSGMKTGWIISGRFGSIASEEQWRVMTALLPTAEVRAPPRGAPRSPKGTRRPPMPTIVAALCPRAEQRRRWSIRCAGLASAPAGLRGLVRHHKDCLGLPLVSSVPLESRRITERRGRAAGGL